MKALLAALMVLLATVVHAEPASAWDPFADEGDAAPPPETADPAPLVVPEGLYLVTDVYTGNAVTTDGNTTTYSTTTAHDTPGTYARVIDAVGTGVASAFDATAMNGRTTLPDGRAVAGTFYQDFVLTSDGYVAVNIVFFQDDAITSAAVPTAMPTAVPSAAATSAPRPSASAQPQVPLPTPAPTSAPAPTALPAPVPSVATAGIALGPAAPVLSSIEVLRGRRVSLWPRAFLDGAPVPVRSWRLVSGTADLVSARQGDGSTACDATWLMLADPGSAWILRFEITTDAAPGRSLSAAIAVVVRSPALEQ